jgi:hypothetical protein
VKKKSIQFNQAESATTQDMIRSRNFGRESSEGKKELSFFMKVLFIFSSKVNKEIFIKTHRQ